MGDRPEPLAKVVTYGGELVPGSTRMRYVQHWQLIFRGRFVADTSTQFDKAVFEEMVEIINRKESNG
jgi:hypothetical protein